MRNHTLGYLFEVKLIPVVIVSSPPNTAHFPHLYHSEEI